MTILAVESDPDLLWALVENLRKAFPGAVIEYTHDARMSNVSRKLDMVFAALVMKRMDGLSLIDFIRKHNNPDVTAYLMADSDDFEEWELAHDTSIGQLYYPVTLEMLYEIAKKQTVAYLSDG